MINGAGFLAWATLGARTPFFPVHSQPDNISIKMNSIFQESFRFFGFFCRVFVRGNCSDLLANQW
jgi:hypothetical protein